MARSSPGLRGWADAIVEDWNNLNCHCLDCGEEHCLCEVEGEGSIPESSILDECICVAMRSGFASACKQCRNDVVDPSTLSPEASTAMSAPPDIHTLTTTAMRLGYNLVVAVWETGVVCTAAINFIVPEQ